MNTEFIPAKEADARTIAMLRHDIWDTTYRGIYPDEAIDSFDYEWHRQRDLQKIRNTAFSVYLIRYCGENVGYFVFQDAGSHVWLNSLYVKQQYQHRGIGKQAFAILTGHCREKGFSHFMCRCNPHNESAALFYQSMGGAVTQTDLGHDDKQEDEVIFEFKV